MDNTIDKSKLEHEFPAYIDVLLNPNLPWDYHITVGTSKQQFGVVKWMLLARSKVLRKMMIDSKLKQDKELHFPDLDPVAFRHFLIYCYGHDHISTVPFNELISMLTIAELYDVPDLKSKLSETIKPKLTSDNVFLALKNAHICDKIQDLWDSITELIQFETENLFSNPKFRNASKDMVLHIVQQDYLSVPEVEVWKAALDWARYQCQSVAEIETPQSLRKTLLPMLKHIRLCSLSKIELIDEVFSSGILTGDEMTLVSMSSKKQTKCALLVNICNQIEERNSKIGFNSVFQTMCKQSSVILTTCQFDIQLGSVTFLANTPLNVQDQKYNCLVTICLMSESSNAVNRVLKIDKQVLYGGRFTVTLRDFKLYAHQTYKMIVTLSECHKMFCSIEKNSDYLKAEFCRSRGEMYWPNPHGTHIKSLIFKKMDKEIQDKTINQEKFPQSSSYYDFDSDSDYY